MFVLWAASTLVHAGCGGAAPAFSVDSTDIELGVLAYEDREPKDVLISNKGQGTLHIYSVATSCGQCTIVAAPKTIRPEQTGTLVFTPPRHRSGPESTRLIITSNDPASPHELYITWFGEYEPKLVPARVSVGRMTPGSILQRRVTVAYAGADPRYTLEVRRTETSSPTLTVRQTGSKPIAKQSDPAVSNLTHVIGEVEFLLTCQVPETLGVFNGNCKFTVAQAEKEYVLTLPVEIHVAGPVSFSPRVLSIVATDLQSLIGKKGSAILLLRETKAAPVVREAPGFIRHELRPLDNQADAAGETKYVLSVEILRAPTGSPFEGRILLEIPDAEFSTVAIPLRVAVF
jgi:hypothetical protein